MVDIAHPNGSGVSRNTFTHYNVGKEGLILNNNPGGMFSSQLGGIVGGNLNLRGAAARLILNEVTGGERSRLLGYTEVAGQKAHVVVANPHGITCDGCGFINTPRVTLTTGSPQWSGEALSGYRVIGGDVLIEGLGLNAENVDRFELITSSARLNAALFARRLEIVTGRNVVDIESLAAKSLVSDSEGLPQFAVDSSALGGMYANTIRLVGTETGVGVRLAGGMAARAGDLIIESGGRLRLSDIAAQGSLLLSAPEINLAGDVWSGASARISGVSLENIGNLGIGGDAQIDAARFVNNGRVAVHDELVLMADTLDNHGAMLLANDLRVTAAHLNNREGVLGGHQLVARVSGALDNRKGTIEAQAFDLLVTALDNRDGEILAAGIPKEDGAPGIDRLEVLGALDNGQGSIVSGNEDFLLSTSTLRNSGGSIRHSGERFALAVETTWLGEAESEIITGGRLALRASEWRNAGTLQAGSLVLDVGRFTQEADGRLIAVKSFTGTGKDWKNAGLLASDGIFSLDLSGLYAGDGIISGNDDLSLSARELEIQMPGKVRGGNVSLSAERFANEGEVSATGALVLSANRFSNKGILGAQRDLTLSAETTNNPGGLMFSGGNMFLRTRDFYNETGDVYSGGDFVMAVDAQGRAAESFINHSGTVEAARDVNVAAKEITNARSELEIASRKVSARLIDDGCDGEGDCGGTNRWWNFILEEVDRTEVQKVSPSAFLLSGGNMRLSGGKIHNNASVIGANGDIAIRAEIFGNYGAQTGEITHRRRIHTQRLRGLRQRNIFPAANAFTARNYPDAQDDVAEQLNAFINEWIDLASDRNRELDTTFMPSVNGYEGLVQAGGAIDIEAEQLEQGVLRPSFAYVSGGMRVGTPDKGDAWGTQVTINPQLPPELSQALTDPLSLPGFRLPSGENGLFRLVAAGHPYLVETNPLLTKLHHFLNSDYLLDLLGYDSDEVQRRLGDGGYEQRLVREAVYARTGRWLLSRMADEEEQFQTLMRNAASAGESLHLSLGVALTAEQVAALTEDIVWLVETEVNGEKVLAPVLYMAQDNGRLGLTGTRITGRDVNLRTKTLQNEGTFHASENLLTTAEILTNSGLIEGKGSARLFARKAILNTDGGIIAGGDVLLVSEEGRILNTRSVTTHESVFDAPSDAARGMLAGSGRRTQRATYRADIVSAASGIESSGDLTLLAGSDIVSLGSMLSAKRNIALRAEGDIHLAATAAIRQGAAIGGNWRSERLDVAQLASAVNAGGNVTVLSGGDFNLIASAVSADGNVRLSAGGGVNLLSAANTHFFEYHRKTGKKRRDYVDQAVRQQGARIEGRNISVAAEGDVTLLASDLRAESDIDVAAFGSVYALSAEDMDEHFRFKSDKGSFGMESRLDETLLKRAVGSVLESGGDIRITSLDNQVIQSSEIRAGHDLSIASGGDLVFSGVKDVTESRHEKTNGGFFRIKSKGRGDADENFRQSRIVADGTMDFSALGTIRAEIGETFRPEDFALSEKGQAVARKLNAAGVGAEVTPQSVKEVVEAMAASDPEMAWLKELNDRGGIDWRRVKERHDHWSYSKSRLGGGVAVVVAVVATVVTYGAASGAIGAAAGSGSAFSAGAAATATSAAASAGLGNVVLSSGIASMAGSMTSQLATTGKVSWNQTLKGGLAAMLTAGILNAPVLAEGTSVNQWAGFAEGPLVTADQGLQLTSREFLGILGRGTVTAGVQSALTDADFTEAFVGSLVGDYAALGARSIGSFWSGGRNPALRTIAHAGLGATAAKLTGKDTAAGAIGGAVESLIGSAVPDAALETPEGRLAYLAGSMLAGGIVAEALGHDGAVAAGAARNAAENNRLLHPDEEDWIKKNARAFAEQEGITEQEAMEQLTRQALRQTDFLWRVRLSDEGAEEGSARAFLENSGQTFENDLGRKQAFFTAENTQLFRPEMLAEIADASFYAQYAQSGVSRGFAEGLAKELKDSGIVLGDSAASLAKALVNNPGAVFKGIWGAVRELPDTVVDSFKDSGHALGEGFAAQNPEIQARLDAIHGLDVGAYQKSLLAIRIGAILTGTTVVEKVAGKIVSGTAKATGKFASGTAKVIQKQLDEVLDAAAIKSMLARGGEVKLDGTPLMDFSSMKVAQKARIGELFGENMVRQIVPDGQRLARMPGIGETGIDDLYRVSRPDMDYVVVEYKFGTSTLGKTADGRQMSDGWLLGAETRNNRILKSVSGDPGLAGDIEASLRNGRVEKWLVHTDPFGRVTIGLLDKNGKFIPNPQDVSKLLEGK